MELSNCLKMKDIGRFI